ncbi:MAG TPA: hypothetical protein VFJ16_09200 [Longimicrobium sp.]|nr:hypothetical protein [Longimicrobium sp.]
MRKQTRRIWPVLAVLGVCFALGGCGDPPGKGPKAERGYERSAPVVAALERYRAERGQYPDSLGALVPRHLPESALRVPERRQERYPLEYHRTAAGFELSFRYAGPGMNECTYTPVDRKWGCSGHF